VLLAQADPNYTKQQIIAMVRATMRLLFSTILSRFEIISNKNIFLFLFESLNNGSVASAHLRSLNPLQNASQLCSDKV